MSSMSREPDLRPQSMEALEYELNKCLAGRGQAVASILGMTTDANVVASLNPGLSTRNLDSGIVHTSARTTTHGEVWETRSGVSRGAYGSGPVLMHPTPSGAIRAVSEPTIPMTPVPGSSQSTNQYGRPATPVPRGSGSAPIMGESVEQAVIPVFKKSGMAVFGWFMLIVLLLGGAGALAYVTLFNKKAATTVPASDGSDGSAEESVDKPEEKGSGKDKSKKKKGDKTEPKANDKTPDKANDKAPDKTPGKTSDTTTDTATQIAAGSATDPDKATKTAKKPAGKQVAVADDKATPKQISALAKSAEAAKDWDAARLHYERLERAKGYQFPGYAVYKQAHAAFMANDITDALTLSERASNMAGNHKLDANLLYADALFKQPNYKRAKDVYVNLAKKVPKEKKAYVVKMIGECNAKLGLPTKHGLEP
jgi:hypothetical protein